MPTKKLAYYLNLKYPISVEEGPNGGFFVTHPDLDGCMAEGQTLESAYENLADSRELWIESRLENGYAVPEPIEEEYSGKVSLRMAPSLHARLAFMAKRQGISLNLLLNTCLASFAGGDDPLRILDRQALSAPPPAGSLLARVASPGGASSPRPVHTPETADNVVYLRDRLQERAG
jgi:antitoxin HicB